MFYDSKGLLLPKFRAVKIYQGKGPYAIDKYYKWPWKVFYRHKLKMIVRMLGNQKYYNILDFGSGPGIFLEELRKHAQFVVGYERDEPINRAWKFDVIVCASVLEFCQLHHTLGLIKSLLKPGGFIVVASPMETKLSRFYFKLIGDKSSRHSHDVIFSEIGKKFRISEYKTWLGAYFCLKAYHE